MALLFVVTAACQPAETPEPNIPNNPNSPGGGTPSLTDNSMRLTPPGGTAFVVNFMNTTFTGTETDSRGGSFYSVKHTYLVQDGNRNFDRIAICFKAEPAPGTYAIVNPLYYGEIPTDKAAMNVTYQGWNHSALSGTVSVSVVSGRLKVESNDLVLSAGRRVTGDTTALPENTRCDVILKGL